MSDLVTVSLCRFDSFLRKSRAGADRCGPGSYRAPDPDANGRTHGYRNGHAYHHADGLSNAQCHTHGNPFPYGHVYAHQHSDRNTNRNRNPDPYTHADAASAYAQAYPDAQTQATHRDAQAGGWFCL